MQNLRIWEGLGTGADAVEGAKSWVEHHLAESRARVDELVGVKGTRTIENTLRPFDRAQWHLRMAGSQSGVMFMVHPEAGVRDAAQELSQGISAEGTALSLNRRLRRAGGGGCKRRGCGDQVLHGPRSAGIPAERRG